MGLAEETLKDSLNELININPKFPKENLGKGKIFLN